MMNNSGGETFSDKKEYAIQFINSKFKNELKSLSQLKETHEWLCEKKKILENEVSLASSEVPSKIERAIHQAEAVEKQIRHFGVRQESLYHDVIDVLRTSEQFTKIVSPTLQDIKDLDKQINYLSHIHIVELISSDISSNFQDDNIDSALKSFQELINLYNEVEHSLCKNFCHFLSSTIKYWHRVLSERIITEFEETLKGLNWPLVATIIKKTSSTNIAALTDKLHIQFSQLVHLHLPENLSDPEEKNELIEGHMSGLERIHLPLEVMMKPLHKRFSYHFSGNRITNKLEKPEWYLTQVLTWLRDHSNFIDTNIQPILDQDSSNQIDAKTEMTQYLMKLVIEKMIHDLPGLLASDSLFAHLVDEVLSFDADIRGNYLYPSHLPGCLHVLCLPEPFDRWKTIERQYSVEKVEALFASPTAWDSQFKDIAGIDDLKVPYAIDMFISILKNITDRYKALPYSRCCLDFLHLQLDLLDDFRIRLVQIMKREMHDNVGKCYTAILNATSFLAEVLRDWNEQPFFIWLQHELINSKKSNKSHVIPEEFRSASDSCVSTTPDTPSSDKTSSFLSFSRDQSSMDKDTFFNPGDLETAVFDDIINLFDGMTNDMLHNVVMYVFIDVKERGLPYRKDKWISLRHLKDESNLSLSVSAYEMFTVLRDHLQLVEQMLSKSLFESFWKLLTKKLDHFFYHEMILQTKFNEGGAAQIQFDMIRNLVPLFAKFTEKPDTYFPCVIEACIVLNLAVGTAILIREILGEVDRSPDSSDCTKTMQDVGVHVLGIQDVKLLLNARTDIAF